MKKIIYLLGLFFSLTSQVVFAFFSMSNQSSNRATYIASINPGSIAVGRNKIAYVTTGSYTFTMPSGFSHAEIFVLAAGGSGGLDTADDCGGMCLGTPNSSGGGGGGGGYYISSVTLAPGSTHTVIVGGWTQDVFLGGGSNYNGDQTSFGTIAYATGGIGGQVDDGSFGSGAGGSGGTGFGTDGVAYHGGNGSAGTGSTRGEAGNGGGAACPNGDGGNADIFILATTGGHGGGGAGFSNTGATSQGGIDADGVQALGGCGGGYGGAPDPDLDSGYASGAQIGRGGDDHGYTIGGGGGFGGGGGGSYADGTGGGGGGALVWIRVF